MLHLKHVYMTFNKNTVNERRALTDINLSLSEGEFVTIIGGNGAGKSTVFNVICGTCLSDSGKIILDGQDITFTPDYKRANQIGRLFQDPLKGTAPSLTIEENLALAYLRGSRRGMRMGLNKADSDFFRDRLSLLGLGLEDRLKTKVGLLSGGQRQALTLLMATIVTPKLLLLDEHTAALDPSTAEKVQAITQHIIKENNITALMITHNIGAALECGTRTIMMDDGSIILDISGAEREEMTVSCLLKKFSEKSKKVLDNDRMLFESVRTDP
jgi:putative ABC transport system ATP-binding protein